MDNLTATVLAASKAGMSYGMYVAAHGIRYANKPVVVDGPTRICPECGEEFSMAGRYSRAIYCSPECQQRHGSKVALRRYHERKEAKKL